MEECKAIEILSLFFSLVFWTYILVLANSQHQ